MEILLVYYPVRKQTQNKLTLKLQLSGVIFFRSSDKLSKTKSGVSPGSFLTWRLEKSQAVRIDWPLAG